MMFKFNEGNLYAPSRRVLDASSEGNSIVALFSGRANVLNTYVKE